MRLGETISFKMGIRDCGLGCQWQGFMHRAIGNFQGYFGSTVNSGIAYIETGIVLSGGCVGVATDIQSIDGNQFSNCGLASAATSQTAALYAQSDYFFTNNSKFTTTFTYTVLP